MSVGRICQREVDTADRDESVLAAAHRLKQRLVGTLVVLNERQEPIGILTDRDLVTRVLAAGRSPAETRVGEVMTPEPRTVQEETPIQDALALMRSKCCRRLPVVDSSGKLAGLVSLDDILALLAEEFVQIGALLSGESPRTAGKL